MTINPESFILAMEKEVANYHTPVVDLIALQTRDPFKVLVATILSARTKDETTAGASRRLFNVAPDIYSLAVLSEDKIRELIHPVGFFNNKAGYLYRLQHLFQISRTDENRHWHPCPVLSDCYKPQLLRA